MTVEAGDLQEKAKSCGGLLAYKPQNKIGKSLRSNLRPNRVRAIGFGHLLLAVPHTRDRRVVALVHVSPSLIGAVRKDLCGCVVFVHHKYAGGQSHSSR